VVEHSGYGLTENGPTFRMHVSTPVDTLVGSIILEFDQTGPRSNGDWAAPPSTTAASSA
jgi:hypothetical protein